MNHTFGAKRKPRKILVNEEEDEGNKDQSTSEITLSSHVNRKHFKKSSKKTINFDDIDGKQEPSITTIVNRPVVSNPSLLNRKKGSADSISNPPKETTLQEDVEKPRGGVSEPAKATTQGLKGTKRKSLRKNLPNLPSEYKNLDNYDRPSYSTKDLNELKNSTPTLPQNWKVLQKTAESQDGIDTLELEGAIIVDTETTPAILPSEAEIREKKERRARLAQEKDFISFSEEPDSRWVSLLPAKKKTESRLVRDDEDFAEGFDEFVDDGRISLTAKQERKARRRQRKEIAEMIEKAQASSDVSSSDSEVERQAAYEDAQTRAGMDGLPKVGEDQDEDFTSQIPARITPLPNISECLSRLQNTLNSMEVELIRRRKKLLDTEQEKRDIIKRQEEVQILLTQAGERIAALNSESTPIPDIQSSSKDPAVDAVVSTIAGRTLEIYSNDPEL